MIEIGEDGCPYYENDDIRQNLIENLGFTFIRINLDPHPEQTLVMMLRLPKTYK